MVADTAVDIEELDLDVRIVEEGPAVDGCFGTKATDNGCDTRKDGDC